jgi:hypothetical protein
VRALLERRESIYKHLRTEHWHELGLDSPRGQTLDSYGFLPELSGPLYQQPRGREDVDGDADDDTEGSDMEEEEADGAQTRAERVAFVQWLCSGPISIASVVKPLWRRGLRIWGLDLPHTYRSVVREIYRESNELKTRTEEALQGQVVSIVTDGVKHARRTFYIVLAAAAARLYFVDLIEMDRADHRSLAQAIGPCIAKLIKKDTIVLSVVSDNASNLERTLNPQELKDSLREELGQLRIFTVRCTVRTSR